MAATQIRSAKTNLAEGSSLSTTSHPKEDMEEFLKAYEKPAQLYRFLQARHAVKPIFLQRSLSYMQHRNSRRGRKRTRPLRIDDLATSVVEGLPDLSEEIVRLEIDFQSIAECGDFADTPSVDCSSSIPSITAYQKQKVEVEVFLYKFSQRQRKPLNTLLPIYNTKSLGKCVVSTMPSGSHDDAQGSHDHSKISIPASELTWKKSPGVSGTHMLVFKCRPLGPIAQVSKGSDTTDPVLSKPNGLESTATSNQHKSDSKTMLPSSHEFNGCNGIGTGKKETVSKPSSVMHNNLGHVAHGSIVPGGIVKKSNNGMIVYDNHRSMVNGCQIPTSVASVHVKNSVKKSHKIMEHYKAFNNKPVKLAKKHKRRKPRRTALALLLAESEQFTNNGCSMNDEDSSIGSPMSMDDTDNSVEIVDDSFDNVKRNLVDHNYAKTANNGVEPPSAKRPRLMEGAEVPAMLKGVCSAELVVFDSRNKCLLQDGQYELVLQECETPSPAAGSPLTWNTIFGGSGQASDGPFQKHYSIKFSLSWSDGVPKIRQQYEQRTAMELSKLKRDYVAGKDVVTKLPPTPGQVTFLNTAQNSDANTHHPVVYNFHYHDNSHLQTEARYGMKCPWCSLDCGCLYSLLCHLTLCHPRVTSVYTPLRDGSLIDVHITKSSSVVPRVSLSEGLQAVSSGKYYKKKPARTELMLFRAGVPNVENLSVFMAQPSGVVGTKDAVLHTRPYRHTTSMFPYSALDAEDSEAEDTPSWLPARTARMIDEFTDVNEGEKELMKLWNLFITEKKLLADQQVPGACLDFASHYKQQLKEKKLQRNFIQHLVSLHEFELLSPAVMHQAVTILLTSNEADTSVTR
ncbi:polycomb protein suz12-B-like isoform X2 [Dysidea avara]|uniref:polycomb protein suz12-B-like isoform X2 n=1 Tax=Dysidea avara TaxID=196820 RepID=UPI00332B5398